MSETQSIYDTKAQSTAIDDAEKLTKLESAIIETYKSINEEAQWYIKVANLCKCKPVKGYSLGICRLINSGCSYGDCPFRLHWR